MLLCCCVVLFDVKHIRSASSFDSVPISAKFFKDLHIPTHFFLRTSTTINFLQRSVYNLDTCLSLHFSGRIYCCGSTRLIFPHVCSLIFFSYAYSETVSLLLS